MVHTMTVKKLFLPPELQIAHNFTGISDELTKTSLPLALAKMGLKSLVGKRVVHIGAGYGNCMFSSYLFGASEVIGVEASQDYILLGENIWRDQEDSLREELRKSKIFSDIAEYINEKDMLEDVVEDILFKHQYFQHLSPFVRYPRLSSSIGLCRVGKDSILGAIGEPADLIVATMVVPWLVAGGLTIPKILEIFSEALGFGGHIVFNVPLFLLDDLEDIAEEECKRSQGIHDTKFYRVFIKELKKILKKEISFDNPKWTGHRKVKSMAVSDRLVEEGICGVHLIGSQWQYFAPSITIRSYLSILGMYETAVETGRPAEEISKFVFEALNKTREKVPGGANVPSGFWVKHYVLKKI